MWPHGNSSTICGGIGPESAHAKRWEAHEKDWGVPYIRWAADGFGKIQP
jgi:hypothetical protein